MELKTAIEHIKEKATKLGMRLEDKSSRLKKNAVWRNNTSEISSDSNSYFGIIREGEPSSQSYSDLCLVFFPSYEYPSKLLMALGVGSEGFRNDYELAIKPGLRRSFLKLLPYDEKYITFCKRQFSDTTNRVDFANDGFSLDRYLQFLLVGVVVDIDCPKDWDIIYGWIARYAQIRGWDNTKPLKAEVDKAIAKARVERLVNHQDELESLLTERKYVVIEGAPGVGKTYTATQIAKKFDKVFFTQFHAGTTYGDFVYGILPRLKSENVVYEPNEGVLLQAMKFADDNPNAKVLLIIDEINRANLGSVLGEVFYLFEPKREIAPDFKIKIGTRSFNGMPKNLFVIGTMNTADRSLAVVDYALRRRFAWYKLLPQSFDSLTAYGRRLFDHMSQIFDNYADDSELNLQPGASYFVGSSDSEINNRLRYELMPLIKEYLLNGLMTQAEQPLDDFFFEHINQRIFN